MLFFQVSPPSSPLFPSLFSFSPPLLSSVMYIDDDQDFARNTISVIVGKCVSPKIWDQVVVYEGLVIVSRFPPPPPIFAFGSNSQTSHSSLPPPLPSNRMAFLLPKFLRGKELAGKIVNPLCGYVSTLCIDLYRVREEGDKQLRRLTVQVFHTISGIFFLSFFLSFTFFFFYELNFYDVLFPLLILPFQPGSKKING